MINRNILIKIIGWKATVLHGDPSFYDRWRWLKNYLMAGPLRTLDAGCGSGALAMYAAKIGNNALGISFNENEVKIAKERAKILKLDNINFVKMNLKSLKKHRKTFGKFNQIICFETMEHIMDDQTFISNLSALLELGGKLILTTPFKEHRALLGESLSEYEDGGHVRWGYTYEELNEIFSKNGLKIIVSGYISGFVSQYITNIMRLLSRKNLMFGWAVTLPLRIFQIIDSSFTKLINYPFLSIGVVGVKINGEKI